MGIGRPQAQARSDVKHTPRLRALYAFVVTWGSLVFSEFGHGYGLPSRAFVVCVSVPLVTRPSVL
eukprot:6545792-Prymnesium_polylepis.1